MQARTPITIITGPLGSGKTTLLRHVLSVATGRWAIVMNEFGEIAIDSKVIEGKSVRLAELAGGCVCCSLLGEFEAAVNEIIETVDPERILTETTGVAEPGALIDNIQEALPQVRLDGVVAVIDADGLLRFPSLGHATRLQIEEADLILLNKVDLAAEHDLPGLEARLRKVNQIGPIVRARRASVSPALLFGLERKPRLELAGHVHEPRFDAFVWRSRALLDRQRFGQCADSLAPDVFRAKGFVHFADGTFLFNFVAGRWELEPFEADTTELVFIGENLSDRRQQIVSRLESCRER